MTDPERFVVFDVETPNRANDRMSAIGVAVVEEGKIVQSFHTLIDPETWFDPFNIYLTGITPQAAAQAPTFPQVWSMIEGIFSRGVLAAHNAPFDMGVLARCLKAYGLGWKSSAEYLCTYRMARKMLPSLENHRLDTLCRHFSIPLEHHRAESDSLACAKLLLELRAMGADPAAFRRRYDLFRFCTLPR